MKIKYQIALCMVFVLAACKENIKKQDSKIGESTIGNQQFPSSKEDVAKAVIRFNNAMVNADSIQLVDLTSDHLTYGHSSGLVQNKEEFLVDVIHGPFNFSVIDNPEQSIQIIHDTAIVRHVFEAKATNSGKIVDIRIGNIQVYHQDKTGKWKLLARQAFKL